MRSKFRAIAKVKQQLLETKEAALLEARANVARIGQEIQDVQEALDAQVLPQKGTYTEVLHVKAIAQKLMEQKRFLREMQERAQGEVNACLYHYKEARKEFEKIKYLEEKEYAAMVKALKKQEQLTLDEVALQLYALGGKGQ